ncbi:MAG: hypothetical protein PHE68_05225 [Candidatus Peribacteraceae bacterium]|nr:hypothetical protein [Candidatus Peribacteraceae bacterium]
MAKKASRKKEAPPKSTLLELYRKQRYDEVERNKEETLLAIIHDSVPRTNPPPPIRQSSHHTTIEFLPKKVNIPEKDALLITSIACLVNRTEVHKVYILKNGEWVMRMVTPLMARILEHLFRYCRHPANRRGQRVKDMRDLCSARKARDADSVISRGIKQIEVFCEQEKIPPFLIQGEEDRWYFNQY